MSLQRILVLCLALLAVSACATTSTSKRVETLSTADAAALAEQISSYVAGELPAATSTIWLEWFGDPQDGSSSTLAAETAQALRDRGFAVTEDRAANSAAHALRIDALAGDRSVLVRVDLAPTSAWRYFERQADGALLPASAYTRRISP